MTDKFPSRHPIQRCNHTRPGRSVFVAFECWETDRRGNPVRLVGYNPNYTPRYELWGCRDCGQLYPTSLKDGRTC